MATLNLKFRYEQDFQKAIEWFSCSNDSSQFVFEFENKEFRSLGFTVQDENDAVSTEFALTNELNETDINHFSFELE
jgi:hypothetical protein